MAEKNGFNITKLIFQNMCVWQCGAVVKEFLASADEPAGFDSRRSRIFCFFVLFSYYYYYYCYYYYYYYYY